MGNTAATWDLSNILAVLTAASFVIIGTLNSFHVVKDYAVNILLLQTNPMERPK